jgi:two-component system OmpR family response regulator
MTLNRGGEPSSGEASGSGRNGFEAFRSSGQRISTERSQATCLVVEDDHVMLHLVMDYLAEHDIRVVSASGRDEVAGLLVREEPNLVILDLRLGQEDGLDLLREIRSSSDVPVIITTGHRRDEIDRVVGLELGADDYITKPFGLNFWRGSGRCCAGGKPARQPSSATRKEGAADLAAGSLTGASGASLIPTESRSR